MAAQPPPGVWDVETGGGVGSPSQATVDARITKLNVALPSIEPPWQTWSQVLTDSMVVKEKGPWFLEIFSGKAGITQAGSLHCH